MLFANRLCNKNTKNSGALKNLQDPTNFKFLFFDSKIHGKIVGEQKRTNTAKVETNKSVLIFERHSLKHRNPSVRFFLLKTSRFGLEIKIYSNTYVDKMSQNVLSHLILHLYEYIILCG